MTLDHNFRNMQTQRRLTLFEREFIEFRIRLKFSNRKIALLLDRNHTVISREIKLNGERKKYSSRLAQTRTEKKNLKRGRKRKLEADLILHDYVLKELRLGKSPDVVAGCLKKFPRPMNEKMFGRSISHEAIYQYIYEGEGRFEGLYQCLPNKQRNRKPRYKRKSRLDKLKIKHRVPIHMRPEEINTRIEMGHWETDSVIYSKQKYIMSVQIERKSRLLRMHKALNKSAEETLNAQVRTIESLPSEMFKSMTFDNGTEGAQHYLLKEEYNIDTYFCDPYSSWQKGGVENMNRIIRRYLPKTKDLSTLTDREIYDIQEQINNTPRKSLGYFTPNEVVRQYVNGGALIA